MARHTPFRVSYGAHEARFSDSGEAQRFAQQKSSDGVGRQADGEGLHVEVHGRDGIIGQYVGGMPTEEFMGRGDEIYPETVAAEMRAAGLPPSMFALAHRARELGLSLAGSDGGTVRVFPGTSGETLASPVPRGFFDGGHLDDFGDAAGARTFLDGVAAGRATAPAERPLGGGG